MCAARCMSLSAMKRKGKQNFRIFLHGEVFVQLAQFAFSFTVDFDFFRLFQTWMTFAFLGKDPSITFVHHQCIVLSFLGQFGVN